MNNKKGSLKTIIITILMFILVVVLAVLLFNKDNTPVISYDQMLKDIAAGKIYGVYFYDDYNANVLYKNQTTNPDGTKNPVFAFNADGTESTKNIIASFKKGNSGAATFKVTTDNRNLFTDWLKEHYDYNAGDNSVTINEMPVLILNDPSSGVSWSSILMWVMAGVSVILFLVIIFSMRGKGSGSGNALNFGKTKARIVTNTKVKFTDVAGAEEEKEELKEIVEFLKAPDRFTSLGAKVPRGCLLVGPPGTGKTLFAKAVAGEANVPFFSISGSDFVEMFVGVGASRVRDLFQQAKKNSPCIIFIDEIDAVGRQRGTGLGGGNDEREQTLNQLLVEMDGFDTTDNIIIMAATNRVDILDPALLRPGRFDRQIYINVPDVRGREEIFKVHAKNKPISPDVDFKRLARLTAGFTGANIANLLNEAAILAARDKRTVIEMIDIQEGINKVIAGPQKKSRVVTETDKRITAYHEAGHAIVGYAMKHCDAIQEVSIISRGQAAGYTLSRPKNDDNHVTKNKLNDMLAMMLGGRVAEEIVIQDISTGASQDIKRATEIARQMVCEWGMSDKLATVFYGGSQEVFLGRDYQTQNTYSEAVAAVIDKEIKAIIDANYKRATDTLTKYREVLDNMVKLLYIRNTIYQDEVEMLMDGATVAEVEQYIADKEAKAEEERKQPAPVIPPVMPPASTVIVKEPIKGTPAPDLNDNGEKDADDTE